MTLQSPIKLLLVEDDTDLRESVTDFFKLIGYQITAVADAAGFYQALEKGSYHVAIIDIGLPDRSGLVLARQLRSMNPKIGIIILTANDTESTKVKGYKAGADNYLVKPVSGPLLESAIESLLVRLDHTPSAEDDAKNAAETELTRWRLNTDRWVLIAPCKTEIELTAREFKFLTCLADAKGGTVTRHYFLELLYPAIDVYTGRAMDAMVRRLRKKITDSISSAEQPIKTVYGSGYCFPQQLSKCTD